MASVTAETVTHSHIGGNLSILLNGLFSLQKRGLIQSIDLAEQVRRYMIIRRRTVNVITISVDPSNIPGLNLGWFGLFCCYKHFSRLLHLPGWIGEAEPMALEDGSIFFQATLPVWKTHR